MEFKFDKTTTINFNIVDGELKKGSYIFSDEVYMVKSLIPFEAISLNSGKTILQADSYVLIEPFAVSTQDGEYLVVEKEPELFDLLLNEKFELFESEGEYYTSKKTSKPRYSGNLKRKFVLTPCDTRRVDELKNIINLLEILLEKEDLNSLNSQKWNKIREVSDVVASLTDKITG